VTGRRWTLPLVAAVAATARAAYFAAHARSPFFVVPVMDARHFHELARALAEGLSPVALTSGFRGALYPLMLSLPYRWAGESAVVVAQLLQHAAGVATALAVALLARRLFADERAALASGLLYAAAPVPLFFEGELLAEPLFLLVAALLLLVLAPAGGPTTARGGFAVASAGALLGVAAQLRPTAWLLLAALPFVAPRAGRARRAALVVAGFAATSLAAAWILAPLQGGFRLLPASSGVNLYLGNRRGADGLLPRQDLPVTHGESYVDSVELFARRGFELARAADAGLAASPDDPATRNRYWLRRAAEEAAADPAGRLALLARKALVVGWNGEVPNNRDFAFAAREETPLLAWLPARFAPLVALAAVGLLVAPRTPARDWTAAFALTHAAGVVLFFVADRYRLPLYLPAAALAGGGGVALLDAARGRNHRALARRLAAGAVAALLSAVDWSGARAELPGVERDLYLRAVARAESGDDAGALADARRAAALAPGDPYPHLQVAAAALALGRLGEADAALAAAARLAPREPRLLNLAGLLYERRGDSARALALFREALRVAPEFAPARHNAERVAAAAAAQRVRRQ